MENKEKVTTATISAREYEELKVSYDNLIKEYRILQLKYSKFVNLYNALVELYFKDTSTD